MKKQIHNVSNTIFFHVFTKSITPFNICNLQNNKFVDKKNHVSNTIFLVTYKSFDVEIINNWHYNLNHFKSFSLSLFSLLLFLHTYSKLFPPHTCTLQHKLLFATQILYINNTQQTCTLTYTRTLHEHKECTIQVLLHTHSLLTPPSANASPEIKGTLKCKRRESPSSLTISEA